MKANTKKGLVIGGVILALGVTGFLIWRANKKREEELSEGTSKESQPTTVVDMPSNTPLEVKGTSASSSKDNTSSSSTKPNYATTPNPNVKRVIATKSGIVIGDASGNPVPMKVVRKFDAGNYLGFSTGKRIMSGSAIRIQIATDNIKGWVLLNDVKLV